MKEYSISRRVWVPRPLATVFPFFADAENLERLTPPELAFRIDSKLPIAMQVGALIDYTIGLYRIPMKWRTEITDWRPPHSFEDTQLSGPYRKWVHSHRFTENAGGTIIEDHVDYALPFGILGRLVHPLVARQLKRIFDYRETVLRRLFV
jgi:ligand-binding SRPBCC domain-containing protein